MERMLVVVFDSEKKAYEGKSALSQLEKEGSVSIYGEAVVVKNADGSTTVKQADDLWPIGTLAGTSVGAMVGVLGGPAGMAVGAVSGMALGGLVDFEELRVGDDFVETVSKSLAPNKVALLAEIEEEWITPVDTRMEALGGKVFRRSLWEVQEQLHDKTVAAMKADLAQFKAETAKVHADRKAKLQARIEHLQTQIHAQQDRVKERHEAFKTRQKQKKELLKKNAAAAARAIKQLAETPL